MRSRAIAIALGVAALAVAAGAAAMLLDTAPRLAGPSVVAPAQFVTELHPGSRLCQSGEALYEGTRALELTLGTYGEPGPPVRIRASHDGRAVTQGTLDEGWAEGPIRIPLERPPSTTVAGEVCLSNEGRHRIAVAGEPADPSVGLVLDGTPQGARISLRSRLAGEPTLLSLADEVAERYGRGNASWLGGWTILLIVALVLGSIGAAGRAVMVTRPAQEDDEGAPVPASRGLRRIPRAGRWCSLAALLGALSWALLTPPFHVPDEVSHLAYVQGVVETGELPVWRTGEEPYSVQEQRLLATLRFYDVIGNRLDRPPWTAAREAAVRAIEAEPLPRASTNATTASANPPLYYLLEAPVYAATRSGSLLDQLLPMRMLSALLGSLTVLAVFLFLRELLPRDPWAWTAGGLAVAFQPLFGFITSGVNADALLFLCCALTFLGMARLLRRGLGLRRATGLTLVMAAGVLTKPLFLALVPAGVAALLVAAIRQRPLRAGAGRTARILGLALLAGALPVVAYHVLASELFDRAAGTAAVASATAAVEGHSLRRELSFVWQLFLPRAPFMNDLLPGVPPNDIWLHGFVGQFGWLDYSFARWVTDIARWVLFAVLALAAAVLVARRRALRARWLEAGCYVLAVAGVLGAIGTQHYATTLVPGTPGFTQARYLFPLLALYAAFVGLAVRAHRRWAPLAVCGVLALVALHQVAALLLTVSRYYA